MKIRLEPREIEFETHGRMMKLVRPRNVFSRARVFFDGELISERRGLSSLHVFEVVEDGQTVSYDVDFGYTPLAWIRPIHVVVRRNGIVAFSNK